MGSFDMIWGVMSVYSFIHSVIHSTECLLVLGLDSQNTYLHQLFFLSGVLCWR